VRRFSTVSSPITDMIWAQPSLCALHSQLSLEQMGSKRFGTPFQMATDVALNGRVPPSLSVGPPMRGSWPNEWLLAFPLSPLSGQKPPSRPSSLLLELCHDRVLPLRPMSPSCYPFERRQADNSVYAVQLETLGMDPCKLSFFSPSKESLEIEPTDNFDYLQEVGYF